MTEENKGIIFLADDEPSVLDANRRLVRACFPGFVPETFKDGNSLEERLKNDVSGVRLVITDNNMPGIKGSDLIEKYARILDVKFILYYAGDNSIGEDAVKNGAFGYLKKPSELSDFEDLVRRALTY